jgi:predicted exporter
MSSAGRGLLLAAWLAVLALLGGLVERRLEVGTDLRLFMPTPRTTQERLVLEEIGEGPASRLLLLAITGPDPAAAAETSSALVARLRDSEQFRWAANGETDVGSLPDELLAYRYLLSPTLDHDVLPAQLRRLPEGRLDPAHERAVGAMLELARDHHRRDEQGGVTHLDEPGRLRRRTGQAREQLCLVELSRLRSGRRERQQGRGRRPDRIGSRSHRS